MARDDWRQSVPDAETFDQLFDKARRKSDVPAAPRFGVAPVRVPPRPSPRSSARSSRVVISTGLALKAPEKAPNEPKTAPTAIRFGTAPPMAPAGPALRFTALEGPSSVESFEDVLLDDAPRVKMAPGPSPVLVAAVPAAPSLAPTAAVRFGPPPAPPARPPMETLPPPRRPLVTLPFLQKRSLTTAGSIVVSATTAAIITGIVFGIYAWRQGSGPSVVRVSEQLLPAAVALAPSLAPLPSAAPAPLPAPAPPPPVALVASAAPAEAPALAELPAGYGRFTVVSSGAADVYLSGRRAGPANEMLEVRCGTWFVRLAKPGEDYPPEWVGAGETVRVACQEMTKVELRGAQSSLVLKRR